MCGRTRLTVPWSVLAKLYRIEQAEPLDIRPRLNISPTQPIPIVRITGGCRHLDFVRWGLVPSWAKDPKIGSKMFNARVETLATKPAFRSALAKRRCLVLADGFYEWKAEGKSKIPRRRANARQRAVRHGRALGRLDFAGR